MQFDGKQIPEHRGNHLWGWTRQCR